MMKHLISAIGLSLMLLCSSVVAFAGNVNINTADAPTLAAQLNGVGPALARAIVADRKANGPFDSAAALARVKGVGQHILNLNKGQIVTGDTPTRK